ncbi:MAG: hypothetical protein HZB76_05550 [Chlamydiae bacterium]|nr:hypothetical protein [Chlamydiota bacterium]
MKKKINFKQLSIEELAAIVSEKLKEHGINSILVGGACVAIYSHNRYQSYDLDYVTYEDIKTIAKALTELDFQKKDKYFRHPNCQYIIEFVSPPVAIGSEPIHQFAYHQTPLGTIKMLTPTDSVKDRLASFYHWNDKQALDQAITICKEASPKIDLQEIKRWSIQEGHLKKFDLFVKELKINSDHNS